METKREFQPIKKELNVFLTEDDSDDRLLFTEAIEELPVSVKLTTFINGEELMQWIRNNTGTLPDVIFLDLNMPLKNGFATLGEIKRDHAYQDIPVIIFSTADKKDMIRQVYKDAAHYFICKPTQFSQLKKLIYKTLTLVSEPGNALPPHDRFILTAD